MNTISLIRIFFTQSIQRIILLITTAALFSVSSALTFATGVSGELEEVLVSTAGTGNIVLAKAGAASVGTVLQDQVKYRPLLRPAEILETIPGMVITQHSGGGKANQYFMRGFNLDHSTDFSNYIEGAPVNMVTHGHGQGYSDLNFLIPELLDRMVYKKGPYYASEGDFSSAGSARIYYARKKQSNKLTITGGEDGYRRTLFTGGSNPSNAHWVYALETLRDDGPWVNPDNLKRENAFLKYSRGDSSDGVSLSGLYFDSGWNGSDQIPRRLVESGVLGRFDSLDNTTGGDTHRYQLSYQQWATVGSDNYVTVNAYIVDYELALYSNFTYFSQGAIDDPDLRGDQIAQFDDRMVYGGNIKWEYGFNAYQQLHIGADLRYDDIDDVGVGKSQRRALLDLNSRAAAKELGVAVYSSLHSQWSNWFASILGLRYDYFDIDVSDKLNNLNSDTSSDNLLSPKLSLRFGPFNNSEVFLNYGKGFHSNDARGVIADNSVPLLSESKGYELGIRSSVVNNLQLTLVAFKLDLDSELVFVGDDGTTEPQDATERTGFELGVYYQPVDWFILDADYTQSKARFKDNQFDGTTLLGDYVPDSVEDVFSLGISFDRDDSFYGGLRLRYFGPRHLTEGGDITSHSTAVINANIGFQLFPDLSVGLEVLNLTDRKNDDITYFYASRTLQERQNAIDPIEDYHSHPMIPRTFRLSLRYEF